MTGEADARLITSAGGARRYGAQRRVLVERSFPSWFAGFSPFASREETTGERNAWEGIHARPCGAIRIDDRSSRRRQ